MRKTKNTAKHMKNVKFNTKKYFLVLGVMLAVVLGIGAIFMGCDFSKTGGNVVDEDSSLAKINIKKEGKINVLLLGVDVEGLRTDAIMLASYDIETSSVNLLSIPRDTRMYIGSKYQKINAAHAIGGMKGKIAGAEGTIEAVTRLTGIPVHYYVEFSFKAIDNFIDALGGVDFDVPDVEGKGRGMNYDDPIQNLHIHLKPGMQHLKGNQVQQLLRYRKSNKSGLGYADGDRGRVEMQQNFIKELVDQKVNAKLILKLPDIFEQLSKDIKTNFTLSDVTKYAGYLKGFSSENISTYQLPGESNGTDYGASYWICDLEATRELVKTVFGYDADKITIDSADGKSKSKDKKKTSSSDKTTKATQAPKPEKEDTEKTPEPTKAPVKTEEPKETVKPTTAPTAKPEKTASPTAEPTAKPTPKPTETPKPVETKQPEAEEEVVEAINID